MAFNKARWYTEQLRTLCVYCLVLEFFENIAANTGSWEEDKLISIYEPWTDETTAAMLSGGEENGGQDLK